MTGAPDGDVHRALAAMGATPLKYYSFGVVAVRPPEHESGPPLGNFSPSAPAMPSTGEGTQERYRSLSVAAVFPLLGLALPEAFHVDVEPIWPVGAPVSERGVMLDRPTDGPAAFASAAHPAISALPQAAYTSVFSHDAMVAAPPGYATPPTGLAENGPRYTPFVMPAWLDPNVAAEAATNRANEHGPTVSLPWLDEAPDLPQQPAVSPHMPQVSSAQAVDETPNHARHQWGRPSGYVDPLSEPFAASTPGGFSPFVNNGVSAHDAAAHDTHSAGPHQNGATKWPAWLQDTPPTGGHSGRDAAMPEPNLQSPPNLQSSHVRADDWSLPTLDEPVPSAASAHAPIAPMPAFAPPTLEHRAFETLQAAALPLEPVTHPSAEAEPQTTERQPWEGHVAVSAPLPQPAPAPLLPVPGLHIDGASERAALIAPDHPEAPYPAPTWHEPPQNEPTWHDPIVREPTWDIRPTGVDNVPEPLFQSTIPGSIPATDPNLGHDTTTVADGHWSGSSPPLSDVRWGADVTPPSHQATPAEIAQPNGVKPGVARGNRPLADMFRALGGGTDQSRNVK
jgi:hypothetical protein